MKKTRIELPTAFTNAKGRQPYSTLFGFRKESIIVSYCPKKGKLVCLISSHYFCEDVDNSELRKPAIILDYNATKSGVDTVDQLARSYTVKHKTHRWPRAIFYNLIDLSAINSYII